MVPLNMTYLHCLQHSLFEHLLNLYYMLIVYIFMPLNFLDQSQTLVHDKQIYSEETRLLGDEYHKRQVISS